MTRRLQDWRTLPPSVVEPLLAAEVRSWRDELMWDVTEAWGLIEPARRAGRLPGFVTTDASGRVTGWTCFFPHRGALQVVALVAEHAGDSEALVEAIFSSPEAESAEEITVCVRDAAPALREALDVRGLDIGTYRYLAAATTGRTGPHGVCRPWSDADVAAVARLCGRAYRDADDVRAFAPHGTSDEWREYVASLLTTPDCGRFAPAASFVIDGRTRSEIDGVVMTSRLGPGTAHIAQVAVDPVMRGRGCGQELIRAALAAAADQGLSRATLLVSAANRHAVRIYQAQGFDERATFVVARARQPRRFSSAALATGGASTRL